MNKFANVFFTSTYNFLLVVLGFFILCSLPSCELSEKKKERDKTIVCDVELLNKEKKLFVAKNHPDIEFRNVNVRTDEMARSGKYAAKLNKENPFGLTINIDDTKKGDYYRATVWRKSENNHGYLVISVDNSKFYLAEERVVEVDSLGWQKIVAEIEITEYLKDEVVSIYLWNDKPEPAYFDDLTIERSSGKIYPQYETEALHIYIDKKGMEKIYKKRQQALKNGILETGDDDWADAILFYKNNDMPAEVRLKGDWLDHLKGKKWSFRIKLEDGASWKGMRVFSIQNPKTRDFLSEWLLHEICLKNDILATRYGFVPVTLNNENLGLYAYEEHFDKQLVESNRRREGPILKFNDDAIWASRRVTYDDNFSFHLPVWHLPNIEPFKEGRIIKSPVLMAQYLLAQNLMYQFKHDKQTASQIFDIKQAAKYFAMLDVLNARHSLVWHNQRFYYNPVIAKLEPVVFDAYTAAGTYQFVSTNITGAYYWTKEPKLLEHPDHIFFKDTVFLKCYIKYLENFTNEAFLDSMLAPHQKEIEVYNKQMKKEFLYYDFDKKQFHKWAKQIRDKLPAFKKTVKKSPPLTASHAVALDNDYDTMYHKDLAEKFVEVFLEQSNDEQSIIRVVNFFPRDILLLGTANNKQRIDHFFHPEPTLYSINKKGIHQAEFKTIPNAKFLFFTIRPYLETLIVPIHQWPKPKDEHPRQKLLGNNAFPDTSLYQVSGNRIVFRNGRNVSTDTHIIIPDGYYVEFEAGASLNLTDSAMFLSYSPVYLRGTAEMPVKIRSADNSGMGFSVMQNEKKSTVSHTVFSGLNTLNYKGWSLTGAVNFYESDVEMQHITFEKNRCEDALNIIRSRFSVYNSRFIHVFADAFDSDFCTGEVVNCRFENIGNDAIDFSGSLIAIDSCNINNAADKGISGGEASTLYVNHTVINLANIGVASKDLSKVYISNSTINDCVYGMTVFQKKPEYGGAQIVSENVKQNTVIHPHLVEENSCLILQTDTIKGQARNVSAIFYAE